MHFAYMFEWMLWLKNKDGQLYERFGKLLMEYLEKLIIESVYYIQLTTNLIRRVRKLTGNTYFYEFLRLPKGPTV